MYGDEHMIQSLNFYFFVNDFMAFLQIQERAYARY